MKKLVASLCLFGLLLLPTASFANQTDDSLGITEYPTYLEDTSPIVSPFDFEYPKDIYDLSVYDSYYFSGQTSQNPLYTNYLFTGKTSYSVSASSIDKSYPLYIIAYKKQFGLDKKLAFTKAGNSASFTFETDDKEDRVYLKFIAPCYFQGAIS